MFYINIVLLIIGVVLLILSIITSPTQQAQQDSTAQPTVPVSDDGNSTSTGGETTASSGSGKNWLALLVVGVIGGMIWWQPFWRQVVKNDTSPALISTSTTGPPLGCPDCVEVPYVFSGGRNFHLNWQDIPGLKPGDTLYLWGVKIEGLGGGPRSNSITPEKVDRGVDIVLAEGYNMPYPLWAKIQRR